ncbi:MAG: hypothetical protein IT363_03800 [Methanoregulaceae archaeon]|nr:hypothetical protein [Methanoregulaceae archaeon]
MRVDALIAIVTISVAILVMTHPHALRAFSSLSWSPWSVYRGRSREFFERASDMLRGVLLGGTVGGAFNAMSLSLPVPWSILIGSLGGVVFFMLLRQVLKVLFGPVGSMLMK